MPNLSTLEFLVGEALSGLFRNRLMATAAVFTAAISLTITAGFSVTALSVRHATEKLPQDFDMAIYLKREVTQVQANAFGEYLKDMPGLLKVTFISKEEGWREFKKSLGAEISTEDVLYNPVLDAYKVSLRNPGQSASLVENIKKRKEVDDVVWHQNEVQFFTRLGQVVTVAGSLTGGLLFLGTAFIIGNTIRLGIFSRRREIAIMRLVGATPAMIRLPFLLEGILIAGVGAGLAAGLVLVVGNYLSDIAGQIQMVTRYFESGVQPLHLVSGMLAVGFALGAVSSSLSIRRYLKEGSAEEGKRL